jgi:hypothetical protein
MSDLDLEVKDEAHMDELGKATDEMMATQMGILAREVHSDSGEETLGEESEEEGSSGGRETHIPRAPDCKIGDRVVYLSQGGNGMRICSVMAMHQDVEGGRN